jgi:hypothetical protein
MTMAFKLLDYERIRIRGREYINVWAPLMHTQRALSIGEQRCLLKAFRSFEKRLGDLYPGFQPAGWVTWVEHDHGQVARMVQRLGATAIVSEKDRTWYAKEVQHVR